MGARKTQEQLEQPVKEYQLDAVQVEVKSLADQMKSGFISVNDNLKVLLAKSETQVTPQQLSDNIIALDTKTQSSIKEEVEKIHLEYRPAKESNRWIIRLLIGTILAVIGQFIVIYVASNGGN